MKAFLFKLSRTTLFRATHFLVTHGTATSQPWNSCWPTQHCYLSHTALLFDKHGTAICQTCYLIAVRLERLHRVRRGAGVPDLQRAVARAARKHPRLARRPHRLRFQPCCCQHFCKFFSAVSTFALLHCLHHTPPVLCTTCTFALSAPTHCLQLAQTQIIVIRTCSGSGTYQTLHCQTNNSITYTPRI